MRRLLRVGLTGGIGSGKSAVSARLADRGAVIVDADKVAREVVEPGTPGLAAVVDEFGTVVLRPDGSLDREKLGGIVFAAPDRLAKLNAIVHPLVGQRMAEVVARAERDHPDGVLVYDIPLLVEAKVERMYDVIVVVDADPQTQLSRLVEQRGMTEADARARIANQASRGERLAVADLVVENNGTLADLDAAVDRLWSELSARRHTFTE